MGFTKRLTLTVLLLSLFALWGCAGIGPHTVARDRFDYTGAIGDSWKEQMLVNTVKLRYGDTPIFLDIASVISQYSVESLVDLRLSWVNPVTSDLRSKTLFTVLMFVFSLTETGGKEGAPIITVPAG